MRNHLLLILLIVLQFGCRTNHDDKIEYIKIITFAKADTVNLYNKGEGLFRYLYYDPKKDSVILRVPISFEPLSYRTYIGEFNDRLYLDTLLSTVKALRQKDIGVIPVRSDFGDGGYSGPTFYFEFKDERGLFCYYFILDGNDTLDRMSDFYHRLTELPWKRKIVENNIINSDYETVTAFKRVGVYEKMDPPYIPLQCDPGIDFAKLHGNWRRVGDQYDNELKRYIKLTMSKNGVFTFARVTPDSSTNTASGTFGLDVKKNTITLNISQSQRTWQILKLTETCFEYIDLKMSDTMRMDRISADVDR